MAIQYSTTHRSNAMTQLNTDIGASCSIKIWTGAIPANCATADSGTNIATFTGNAGGFGTVLTGVLTASAVASTVGINGGGTAVHFRIYNGANCIVQGTCGLAAADMILTNTSIANGQTCNFTSMTITAYGA